MPFQPTESRDVTPASTVDMRIRVQTADTVKRWPAVLMLLVALVGCDLVRFWWTEDLSVKAASTSLGVGESVRVTVRRKASWFRTAELRDPSRTVYATTSESALVIEPDGWVTCIGTYGRPQESAWVVATNGASHGHLNFDLSPQGPGPTLELVPASSDLPPLPNNARTPFTPCCASPLAVREGQRLRFTVRARASGRDLTSSSTGTRYTLFFGSGEPNDPHPEIVTGGPPAVSATTVQFDDRAGMLTAPPSLGRLNRARIILFFRNDALVGWREIVVVHR